MIERMTEEARNVVHGSLREALKLGHNYIHTEHLLLALIRESDCAAAEILTQLGVDRAAVVDQLRARLRDQLSGEESP